MQACDAIASPAVSPRIRRLRARLEQDFAGMRGHKLTDAEECKTYARLAYESYAQSVDRPRILRRAEFLTHFAANVPIIPREDDLIVGSQRFTAPPWRELFTEEQLQRVGIHGNHGHIIVDYGRLVRDGIPGLRQAIAAMPEGENRTAFSMSLEAFATFVSRYGFAELGDRAPATFHEALQLTWFVQIFLSAEGLGAAISFGRLDQFLWPFLEADLKAGRCAPEQAFELVCAFFIKCCEGAESQNLTVGGPGENPLSIMLVRAMRALKVWQPSLSVRIAAGSSDASWEDALTLCETGIGMPSFFNDPVVTASLEKLGIPPDRAADFGIVGCYEASPQGDACPLTVGGGFALPEMLNDFLQTQPAADTFDAFKDAFKVYVAETYRSRILPEFGQRLRNLEQHGISPFESLCVTGCIESGRAAEQAGARFNLFGVNILGIGTLVDSLLAVKLLVFDEQALSLAELTAQVEQDFPDERLRQRCRGLSGKFGSDMPVSNALTHELSAFIANEVLAARLPNGVRPYPGFHLQVNIVAAEDLKKAKAAPERYQDLTVRISGFSARFVNLDAQWQDAIIERTERRM